MGACSSIKNKKNKPKENPQKPPVQTNCVISKNNNSENIPKKVVIPKTINQNNNNLSVPISPHPDPPAKVESTTNEINNSGNVEINPNSSFSQTNRTNVVLYDNPANNEINFNVTINDEFPSLSGGASGNPNQENQDIFQVPHNSNRINDEREPSINRLEPQLLEFRNAQDSLRQMIRLVRNFNPRFYNNNNMLTLLGLNEEMESKEYFNWTFNQNNNTWFNKGKIILTEDELQKIEQLTEKEVSNKNYYVKRIWFAKYINKNIYDKGNDNSPLVVSRNNILEESFNQFMTSKELNLKANMHIFFVDEIAYDVGGVYREWYSCLFKEIFAKKNNFFYENFNSEDKGSFMIPVTNPTIYLNEYLLYYEFIGKVIGKALFDKITIGQNFNKIILKHLMNYSINQFTIEDLKYYDKEIYRSLNAILSSNMDENDDLYFVWEIENKEYELIPGGKNKLIKNDNKNLFVNKVINFLCYESISKKIDKIKEGFDLIMGNKSSILQIFTLDEFNFLLSGQSTIDLTDWKENTYYKGSYTKDDGTIKMFWDVLNELSHEELLVFYKFCTGCSRVPIDGFGSLQGTRNKLLKFCIESPSIKGNSENRLIEAQTCFNRICLPEYGSKEKMKKAIYTIINNDTNFFGLK